ncbi:MAG: SDR family NAD(P)-dependent oxidoreductase, partial [Leptospiraceae bacterium]|nr:SDR family NAD(P)-dependent oxidoreductase [Leptospiraceae bacterium]
MDTAQTICISGASSGFGAACAREFGKDKQARLILLARSADKLQSLANEIGPERTLILPLDIQDKFQVIEAIETLTEPFRAVDILVNNAGL